MHASSLHSSVRKTGRFATVATCLLILLLTVPFLLHAQQKSVTTAKWEKVLRPLYSISAPQDWRIDTAHNYGIDLYLFSPKISATDSLLENVNVVCQKINSAAFNLQEFVDMSVNQVKQILGNTTVLRNETVTENDRKYHLLQYEGLFGKIPMKFTQHFYVKDGWSYAVTLTTGIDTYDRYKDIGFRIMKSIVLEPNTLPVQEVIVEDYVPAKKQ